MYSVGTAFLQVESWAGHEVKNDIRDVSRFYLTVMTGLYHLVELDFIIYLFIFDLFYHVQIHLCGQCKNIFCLHIDGRFGEVLYS